MVLWPSDQAGMRGLESQIALHCERVNAQATGLAAPCPNTTPSICIGQMCLRTTGG